MSAPSNPSEYNSLPSSLNASSYDYGDKDENTSPFPIKEPSPQVSSSVAHISSTILRLRNKIRCILGETTEEHIEFLADIYYQWKYFGKKYPDKHKDIIEYINRRILYDKTVNSCISSPSPEL